MAKLAQGTKILMGDGQPTETFTEIPAQGDIEYNPPQPEQLDATNHDSTDREYLPGLGADGELTSDVQVDFDNQPMQLALRDKHGVAAPTNFKMVMPDTRQTTSTFAATVAIQIAQPVGDISRMPYTLRITGTPVWTP